MKYIIDFNLKNKNDNILEKIINEVRFQLGDIKSSALVNKCDYVTRLICDNLDIYRIDYNVFETHKILGNDVLGHMFLVVYIDDKSYIVDLTYLQFFLKDRCSESMYKELDGLTYSAPDPGFYYVEHSDKIDVAKSILENGYIELNDRSIKTYLDSFFENRRGRRINYEINANTYMNVINKEVKKR